jgi:hypothetical protein
MTSHKTLGYLAKLFIDLTDYFHLPNGLFSMLSARKGYVPTCLICTNLFVVELKLSHKHIFLTLLYTNCE